MLPFEMSVLSPYQVADVDVPGGGLGPAIIIGDDGSTCGGLQCRRVNLSRRRAGDLRVLDRPSHLAGSRSRDRSVGERACHGGLLGGAGDLASGRAGKSAVRKVASDGRLLGRAGYLAGGGAGQRAVLEAARDGRLLGRAAHLAGGRAGDA